MLTYLKCVYANKATLLGFVFLVCAVLFGFTSDMQEPMWRGLVIIMSFCSLCLLFLTFAGLDTMDTYCRTREIIAFGSVELARRTVRPAAYCTKVGFELALRETPH